MKADFGFGLAGMGKGVERMSGSFVILLLCCTNTVYKNFANNSFSGCFVFRFFLTFSVADVSPWPYLPCFWYFFICLSVNGPSF